MKGVEEMIYLHAMGMKNGDITIIYGKMGHPKLRSMNIRDHCCNCDVFSGCLEKNLEHGKDLEVGEMISLVELRMGKMEWVLTGRPLILLAIGLPEFRSGNPSIIYRLDETGPIGEFLIGWPCPECKNIRQCILDGTTHPSLEDALKFPKLRTGDYRWMLTDEGRQS
jgi:hypothetical protein